MKSNPQLLVKSYESRSQSSVLIWRSSLSLVFAVGALVGCTPMPTQNAGMGALLPSGQVQCTGNINPPYGVAEVDDQVLLRSALGTAGKGGLCKAKVFRVLQPLTVYRVWDAGNAASQYGRWWSFNPPAGPVETYRAQNAICPNWSRLDRVKQCHLKVGAEIVIGLGQSAQCDNNITYPQSANTQIFVPNDTRDSGNMKLGVTDCLGDVAWP